MARVKVTAQRSPWPVVGTKVWVPDKQYAGDRDMGDVFVYTPVERLVLGVGVNFVIFDTGPELQIATCKQTKDESIALCREWNTIAKNVSVSLT